MSKNIVILGAGFGGIRAALDLARTSPPGCRILLIDRNVYHIYYPRLYELALAEDGFACTVEMEDILKGTQVEFVQGEVRGLDCKRKKVEVAPSPDPTAVGSPSPRGRGEGEGIQYDYLVLALGAGTDYFGIEGLAKYGHTLKSIDDAKFIRQRVGDFLDGVRKGNKDLFEVVIGGAGATGIEVAAEMAYLFQDIPRGLWSVRVIEALSSVLWMFPPEVGNYAHKHLIALGVHVMLDTCIKMVESAGSHPERSEGSRVSKNDGIPRFARNDGGIVEVVLAPRPLKPGETEAALVCDFLPEHEKRVSADLLLWAGGIRANPLIAKCGVPTDRKGRVEVDEYMKVKGLEGVFALGDNASLVNPSTNQPVPATAQAAIEQGRLVAENIARLIKGGSSASPIAIGEAELPNVALRAYRFHDFPAVIPLANRDAIAYVGGRAWRGLIAWLLRQAADIRYFASILGWWKALKRCRLK